jgi:hypothetical protein
LGDGALMRWHVAFSQWGGPPRHGRGSCVFKDDCSQGPYEHDLKGIQKKAMEKGIPYQTLISGMIHQYVEGDLVESR